MKNGVLPMKKRKENGGGMDGRAKGVVTAEGTKKKGKKLTTETTSGPNGEKRSFLEQSSID